MGRPAKPDGERVRDISPTGIRLPPDLRDYLVRLATINGRSLGQEITARLTESRNAEVHGRARGGAHRAEEPPPRGTVRADLSDLHRQLLSSFDTLTPDRQLALLTLLKR